MSMYDLESNAFVRTNVDKRPCRTRCHSVYCVERFPLKGFNSTSSTTIIDLCHFDSFFFYRLRRNYLPQVSRGELETLRVRLQKKEEHLLQAMTHSQVLGTFCQEQNRRRVNWVTHWIVLKIGGKKRRMFFLHWSQNKVGVNWNSDSVADAFKCLLAYNVDCLWLRNATCKSLVVLYHYLPFYLSRYSYS